MKIKLRPPKQTTSDLLRTRAQIRRQIPTRKSVQNNEPDRLADLLERAADELDALHKVIGEMDDIIMQLERRLNEQEQFREDFSKHD